MGNLIVDIGNTRVKLAVINTGRTLCLESFEGLGNEFDEAVGVLVGKFGLSRAIVSSTRGCEEDVVKRLRAVIPYVLLFDSSTPVPIKNSYSTPQTLGRDRLAAAVGAATLYGDRSSRQLIVDIGSAITIDLVTRDGGFEGGVISPGMTMRFRALSDFTAKLPLCHATDEVLDVARTTKEAIEQGVMEGITYEIEGHIVKNMQKECQIIVIFTGGDAKKFVNRIKNAIFAECELVIVGLNRILDYNAK